MIIKIGNKYKTFERVYKIEGITPKKIYDQAEYLADILYESEEYREYCQAREELKLDKENAMLLSELRQRQLQLHLAQLAGEDIDEEIQDLEDIYTAFSLEPTVARYLSAENRFTRLLTNIQRIFTKKISIWPDFNFLSNDYDKTLN